MKWVRILKQLLAATGLATAVATASASPIPGPSDWGAHDTVETGGNVVAPGSFQDAFPFSLAAPTTLFASAASVGIPGVFDIAGGTVSLFKDVFGPDLLIGSFGFDGTTGTSPTTFSDLAAGHYYYLVSGTGLGLGGLYSLVSAVPEPETYALLLAGLMMVLVLSRRRMND